VARAREQGFDRCLLDNPSRIHDRHPAGHLPHQRKVVADQQQRGAGFVLDLAEQGHDLRLHRHVERGGRLVGDDQRGPAGQGDRDHHALAHSSGDLVGIFRQAPFGRGEAHGGQQLDGARACRGARSPLVIGQRFDDLASDREHGVQARHRLLEDHGDPATTPARRSRAGCARTSAPFSLTRPVTMVPAGAGP
jgi:hypothetical protein